MSGAAQRARRSCTGSSLSSSPLPSMSTLSTLCCCAVPSQGGASVGSNCVRRDNSCRTAPLQALWPLAPSDGDFALSIVVAYNMLAFAQMCGWTWVVAYCWNLARHMYLGLVTAIGSACDVKCRWIVGSPDCKRKKTPKILPCYDPGRLHANHCLFACIARILLARAPTPAEVAATRRATAELWWRSPLEFRQITADKVGLSQQAYAKGICTDLWGGLPDVLLWVRAFNLQITVQTPQGIAELGDAPQGDRLLLHNLHYTVTSTSRHSCWRSRAKTLRLGSRDLSKYVAKYIDHSNMSDFNDSWTV
eukprot:3632631-Amphidinium_carterae.1